MAVVDKNVDKKGTRKVAEAYLQYLYTRGRPGDRREATSIARRDPKVAAKYAKQFPKLTLFTIDDAFGGWPKAQKTHFADGGDVRPDLPARSAK